MRTFVHPTETISTKSTTVSIENLVIANNRHVSYDEQCLVAQTWDGVLRTGRIRELSRMTDTSCLCNFGYVHTWMIGTVVA